ncbi:MAG: hypothetical protein HKN46_05500 [Acidimicrobiia bacterium]|nr:hypothetical protein [Acidimicrobiia bacterium]
MKNHKEFRNLYWWHMPVHPQDEPTMGRDMLRNVLVWLLGMIAAASVIASTFQAGA